MRDQFLSVPGWLLQARGLHDCTDSTQVVLGEAFHQGHTAHNTTPLGTRNLLNQQPVSCYKKIEQFNTRVCQANWCRRMSCAVSDTCWANDQHMVTCTRPPSKKKMYISMQTVETAPNVECNDVNSRTQHPRPSAYPYNGTSPSERFYAFPPP